MNGLESAVEHAEAVELLKISRVGVFAGVGDRLDSRLGQSLLRCVLAMPPVLGGEEGRVYPPSSMLGELEILSIMSSSPSASDSPPSPPSSPF